MSTINLTLDKDVVVVKPAGYLAQDFSVYNSACRSSGFRFHPSSKTNRGTVERLPLLVEMLKGAGFELDFSESLVDAIGDTQTQSAQDDLNADAHFAAALDRVSSGIELFPFQRDGVKWLLNRKSAGIFDEMGLGKTVQALVAAPADEGILVVCPKTLIGNWVKECAKFLPGRPARALKTFELPQPGELVAINYERLPNVDELDAVDCKLTLIADEVHKTKTPKAARTKRFRALAKAVRAAGGRTWGLSGTPLTNKPNDLWNVLHGLDLSADAFGTYSNFCRVIGLEQKMIVARGGRRIRVQEWNGQIDKCVPELLRRVSLRRERKDVLPDLRKLPAQDIVVEINATLRKQLNVAVDALKGAGIDIDSRSYVQSCDIAETTKTSGVLFQQYSEVRAALAKAKVPAMLDIVDEYEDNEEPLVVFSKHRDPIELLGQRDGWGTIIGDKSAGEREQTVADFQAGKLKGIALTIGSGAEGITLTRASHVLFVDLEWNPSDNSQAVDRCCRIGQTDVVTTKRLVCDHPIDASVLALLDRKAGLFAESVGRSTVTDVPVAVRSPSFDHVIAQASTPRTTPGFTGTFGKHAPQTEREMWAAEALLLLKAYDPDRASEDNGVGFNRLDGDFGHSLADQLDKHGALSAKQWRIAERICAKYHGQVGRKIPDAEAS